MTDNIQRRKLVVGTAAVAACATLPSFAQSDRPISLIVPAPPGGSNDVVGRAVAEALTALLQRPVVVENKPGGSGVIGFGMAVKGPADGTMFAITSPSLVINPWVMKTMPFDPLKDLSGVAGLAQSPAILVAHRDLPAQSVRELKALFQREPSRATFAAGDNATLLATMQLLAALGAKATTANYKGTVPAMTDVAGGHISLAVTVPAAAMPFVKGGQVKVLGLLSRARLKALPDVPTMTEQGVDVEFQAWNALHASAHVPKAIVAKLSADLHAVVNSPAFAARIEPIFSVPMNMGAAELDAFVAQQMKKMGQLASAAGLQPE